MANVNILKGALLIGIAIIFAIPSLKYSLGTLSQSGPGLFPFSVSMMLIAIGGAIIVRGLLTEPLPLTFRLRNIGLVTISLLGFVLASAYINMLAAIVIMVLMASMASDDFSVLRAAKIAGVLAAIGFALRAGLGFQLPLF